MVPVRLLKHSAGIWIILALTVALCSCGSSHTEYSDNGSYSDGASPMNPGSYSNSPLSAKSSSGRSSGNAGTRIPENTSVTQESGMDRMVYYEAYLTVEVEDVEASVEKLKTMLKGYEGFIVNSTNNSIRFRVRNTQMNKLIEDVGTIGKISRKKIAGNDITDIYQDTKIRLENAYKARENYQRLMEKATTVDEMLRVEAELQRVTEKIELLEGQIKRYSSQVEYSLVEVRIEEESTPGPLGWLFVGLYEGFKWLFVWD